MQSDITQEDNEIEEEEEKVQGQKINLRNGCEEQIV